MPEFSSGTVVISSGVTSTGIVVVKEAQLHVRNGGLAIDAGAAGGGAIVVSGGGQMEVCTVSSGGTATVLNEGCASDVMVEDEGVYLVSSGGYATKSEVRSGGEMRIFADVRATGVVVKDGGTLEVNTDGYARAPFVSQGGLIRVNGGLLDSAGIAGTLEIDSGGVVSSSTVFEGGKLRIRRDDSFAMKIVISSGGTAHVSAGGELFMASMFEGASVIVSEGGLCTTTKLDGGTLAVLPGASLEDAAVNPGGTLHVFSGGGATGVRENGGYVDAADGTDISFASNTISSLLLANASATVHCGTTAKDVTVGSGGRLDVFSGGKLTGIQTFENGAVVSMNDGGILDFDISEETSESTAHVNDLSVIQGAPLYTLTVSSSQSDGMYALAGGAAGFNGSITVQNTLGTLIGSLVVGETLKVGDSDWTLNLNKSDLLLTIKTKAPLPDNLVGTKDRVSWDSTGASGYTVEYSTDNFVHTLCVETTASAVDMLGIPAGTYQWRVKSEDGEEWAVGDEIVSDNDNAAKLLQSNADGNDDLFFAKASGTWENIFYAQHVGSINDWSGTKEVISASGKNRIADLFFGYNDANILCLTDDENGDGIFVDDEYTELPEGIIDQQSRIAQIDEIRAGAGDDIVDMTSNRLEYIGEGLTIRGGDGNDTIWANKGNNWLFGDAGNDRIVGASGNDVIAGGIGNDRIHGGGGNDIFTFCDNWGVDEVEQLAGGKVTLWFASGDESKWNPDTLTYIDGDNSITVKGVTSVELKFGDDGSEQYKMLAATGAFAEFTSQKIFEESQKGMLAGSH